MRASTVFRDLRWLVLLAVSLVSVSNAQNGWLTTVDAAYISANQQQGALVFESRQQHVSVHSGLLGRRDSHFRDRR